MELTILIPCLNEEETIENCIKKAQQFLANNKIDGEVLVADNGSTDGSIELAKSLNASVVFVEGKGYGSALKGGCKAAHGEYVIMGDADDSYDFSNLMPFLERLREGFDLVIGNRFTGGIEPGAMSWSHRYIGNPVLSFVGRLFFNSKIHDFHCGLRGYNRNRIMALDLYTTGMEYASEMIVRAELSDYKIAEVPTTLRKDGRSRSPHLRSFRDGWRHLKFLFMYAPNWLFLYPGIILFITGLILSVILMFGQFSVFGIILSIHTLLYASAMIVSGITIIGMFIMVKIYAHNHGYLPGGG